MKTRQEILENWRESIKELEERKENWRKATGKNLDFSNTKDIKNFKGIYNEFQEIYDCTQSRKVLVEKHISPPNVVYYTNNGIFYPLNYKVVTIEEREESMNKRKAFISTLLKRDVKSCGTYYRESYFAFIEPIYEKMEENPDDFSSIYDLF